jgi:uncharacterized protein (AIM24 family)
MVIARTDGIKYTVRRPTHSFFSYLLSGQKCAHVYQGTGRLLISTTPYWRFAMKSQKAAQDLALME